MKVNNDLEQTTSDVASILVTQGIPFHLTGGLVSSYYGEPRFTQDIDIVVEVKVGNSLDRFLDEIKNKFFIDPVASVDAVNRRGMFQALHRETMIKVDFHVGEDVPGELNRSKVEELFAGMRLPLVSKEDAILSKLLWVQKGSHKSRRDARMMLIRSPAIDQAYLTSQATKLGVDEILGAIISSTAEEDIT